MHDSSISQQVINGIAALKRQGMTDRAIAKATGLSHVTILRWASGDVSPNTRNAEKFLSHLPLLVKEQGNPENAVKEIQMDVNLYADTLLNVLQILKKNNSHSYALLQVIDTLAHAE